MKILIKKINNGVTFTPLRKDGERVAKVTEDVWVSLEAAVSWYKDAAVQAFKNAGLEKIQYAIELTRKRSEKAFRLTPHSKQKTNPYLFLRLEPVGWAVRHLYCNGNGCNICHSIGFIMKDTGSTPTPGRIRVLLCYQAPLERIELTRNSLEFRLEKEFL